MKSQAAINGDAFAPPAIVSSIAGSEVRKHASAVQNGEPAEQRQAANESERGGHVRVRRKGQGAAAQSCLEKRGVQSREADERHLRPPEHAAQIKMGLHDQKERPGHEIDRETRSSPWHERSN